MTRGKKVLLWIGGAVVAMALLIVGGTWVYIHLIKDEPPAKLTLETGDTSGSASTTPSTDGSSATTAASTGGAVATTIGRAATLRRGCIVRVRSTGRGPRPTSRCSATGSRRSCSASPPRPWAARTPSPAR